MSGRNQDRIDIDVYIKHKTDAAILVRDEDDVEHWLPKVLIEYEGDVGDTTTVDMPEWLAIEKGLG